MRVIDILQGDNRNQCRQQAKGISPLSYLASTEDFSFFTTRRYRDLRKMYVPGKFSLLEFLLKVSARLIPRR